MTKPTSSSEKIEPENKCTWLTKLKQDRKLLILTIICAGLGIIALIVGVITVINILTQPANNVTATINVPQNVNIVPPAPTVLPRALDGLLVAAADANKVPACVMIENAAFDGVRPQAGLSSAQVVYEIIVEGGITRLMAVFGGEQADTVGPVRSARDTYLQFASEYNCAYTHAGGSPTAMQALEDFSMRDLDGLRESQWFWRDSKKYSPHNLFTSTAKLYEAISAGHSWIETPTYIPWTFADNEVITATATTAETANEINVYFTGSYDVKYTYNATEKYYERVNGGKPHTDANTNKILTARNIIIETVPAGESIEGKGRINFDVVGAGDVYIFRLGKLTKGTWKKADRLARTQFFTEDGKEIPLVRGNTWVELVPTTHKFDWK
ncbi:MAG: DUF3048 domain-containing protein [Patescibacteria group bacterium]|jgi:hypothetical protein